MSEQHVFPDRLRRVVPRINGIRSFGARGRYIKQGDATPYSTEKRNQGSMGSVRIRRVCRSCNHGWLNTMEEECVPTLEEIIQGKRWRLYRPHQRHIERVAVSMTMVGEWLHKTHVSTKQSERDHFRETLSPPPGWSVFLGRNGTGTQPGFRSDGLSASNEDDVEATKLYSSFTATVGPVLLHVFAHTDEVSIDPPGYARHMGLALMSPVGRAVDFGRLPVYRDDDIEYLRSYAANFARRTFGH